MSDTQEKERKGTGVPTWMTGAARVGGSPGAGGLSAAGGAGKLSLLGRLSSALGSKGVMYAAIAGGLAIGGHGIFDMNQRGGFGASAHKQVAQAFAEKPGSGARGASGVQGDYAGPSGLELAYKANQGALGGAEKAAEQDAAAAEGGEDGQVAEAPAGAAGAAAGDPAAQAHDIAESLMGQQSSKAKAGGGMDRRFGKLSSSLGSAKLAGGAGLAGGIGGNFNQQALKNSRMGEARGMKGGVNAGASRSKAAPRGLNASKFKGANAKKLDNMSKAMGSARSGPVANTAALHQQQWDGAQPGGSSLSGAGASGIGDGGGAFSDEEGGGGGGPLDTNANSANPSTSTSDPPPVNGENVTPWQKEVDLAQMLMTIASILLLVATIMGSFKEAPILGQAWYAIAKALAYAAMALSAVVTVLGVMIMAKGQMLQGLLFTATGALMTYLSYVAAENIDERSAAAKEAAEKGAVEEGAKDTGLESIKEGTKKGVDTGVKTTAESVKTTTTTTVAEPKVTVESIKTTTEVTVAPVPK